MRGIRFAASFVFLLPLISCGKDDALSLAKEQIQHVQEVTAEFMANRMDAWGDQMSKLDTELDNLRAQAEQKMSEMSEESRAKLAEAMIALEGKREQLGQKLMAATDASSAAWDEVETGFENAWEELQTAMKEAQADVK